MEGDCLCANFLRGAEGGGAGEADGYVDARQEDEGPGGIADVKVQSQVVMLVQDGLGEMVEILTVLSKDIVGKEWIEEKRGRIGEGTGKVMREQRERFTIESDGKVGLMVAWIALGRKTVGNSL